MSTIRYTALAAAALLLTAACGDSEDDGGGGALDSLDSLSIIVPVAAGGGADTNTRLLQSPLAKSTGLRVDVENIEGGSSIVGTNQMLNKGEDCSTLLSQQIPGINFSTTLEGADFDIDDFAPIAQFTADYGSIRVMKDSPYKDFQSLLDAAKERPGEISVSVSAPQSANNASMQAIEEAAGVDFNVVPFDGGGPSRTALLGGQVEVTHSGIFNSLDLKDQTRVLAVQASENKWADITDDAPTVNEVLGTTVPDLSTGYALFASAECADKNPELFEALTDAVVEAAESDEFADGLAKAGEERSLSVVTGAEFQDRVDEAQKAAESLAEQN